MDTILFARIALFIHIVSLITGFGSVLVIDTFGLLWLLKKVPLSFVMKVANVTQRLIWLGWFGLVASGSYMLLNKGFIDNLTWMKLFFVALVGLNGIWLHLIKKGFERIQDNPRVPAKLIFDMSVSTTVSQVGWWSAILIGFLHHEWRGNITWPPNPFVLMAVIIGALFITLAIGKLSTRKS